jgi:glutamate racemase
VLGTQGTIASNSYGIELAKLAPRLRLVQQACPLWVPLVESGELTGPGTEHFLHKYLDPLFAPGAAAPSRLLLACTHYPLLASGIRAAVPTDVEVIAQGPIVAEGLAGWLERHPDFERRVGRRGARRFATTDDPGWFAEHGAAILGRRAPELAVERVRLHPFRER